MPAIWDEPVAANLAEELARQAALGLRLVFGDAPPPRDPAERVRAMMELVDATNAGKAAAEGLDLALACAWGEEIRAAAGLRWVDVRWPGGNSIALVPDDRRYVLRPLPYFKRMLSGPSVDNTVLLLFNMVVAGNVPRAAPKSYVALG